MLRQVGPVEKFVDGFGIEFVPDLHWSYIQLAMLRHEQEKALPQPPPVEPEWKDRPAGFRHCPVLFEDEEQGHGHWA